MDFSAIKEHLLKLDTPQICDVENNIPVMNANIRPQNHISKLVGTAFTVKTNGNIDAVLDALSQSSENDVLIIDAADSPWAMAGEIFTLEAKRKKLSGIILDGFCRDIAEIKTIDLPVFSKGIIPKKVKNNNSWKLQIPVTCGGCLIHPGNIIFADENGIVVLDSKNLTSIIEKAKKLLEREIAIKKQLNEGTSLINIVRSKFNG